MSLIEFRGDAACAVAGCLKPPTTVWHHVSGVYAESDPHFCDAHRDTLRPEDVPLWTRGWEAGYARGRADLDMRARDSAAILTDTDKAELAALWAGDGGEVEYAECTCGHYHADHGPEGCQFVGCGCFR